MKIEHSTMVKRLSALHTYWLVALLLFSTLVVDPPAASAAAPALPPPGLAVETALADGARSLVVRSAGRFALRFVSGELVAWYDLRRDPGASRNLAASGGPLLAHSVAGAPLPPGELAVVAQSPVRVTLERIGVAGEPPGPFRLRYSIWAGGQIDLAWEGPAPLTTLLLRDPAAITGAALSAAPALAGGAAFSQTATLFLDAWTGEQRAGGPLGRDGVLRATAFTTGAASAASAANPMGAVELRVPPELSLRAPRFELVGWPGPALSLRRGATTLVAGQDYLADYDAASATLVVQYLHPLPAALAADDHSFTFAPAEAPALSLGVEGRNVDENGLLVVDGNLPDGTGTKTTLDLFRIPYIQSTRHVTVTAAFQGQGAGVELVLSGGALTTTVVRRALGPAGARFLFPFALPGKGEYRLEGYILDAQGARQNAAPDDLIAPLGYGRVVMAIGDSITAGVGGDKVAPGDPGFPVTTAASSPAVSADGRNFYQYDSANGDSSTGTPASFYRGYQLSLNDRLTQCTGAPVFVLNSGFSALRTRLLPGPNPKGPNLYAYAKLPAYLDLVQKLGAGYLFVGLGTNDVADAVDPTVWATEGMAPLIAGLQSGAPDARIWVPTIPYTLFSAGRLTRTRAYNAALPGAIATVDKPASPVYAGPDLFAAFEANQNLLTADKIHPSAAGYELMAQLWADAATSTMPCSVMRAEPPDPAVPPDPPAEIMYKAWLPLIARGALEAAR